MELDAYFLSGGGGSSLTIGGTLTNSSTNGNALDIGYANISTGDTVTAKALSNSGAISDHRQWRDPVDTGHHHWSGRVRHRGGGDRLGWPR